VVGAAVVGVDVGLMGVLVVGALLVGVDVGALVVLRGLGDDPPELRLGVGGLADVADVDDPGAIVGAVIGATHETV
jgi:hypothetical protein